MITLEGSSRFISQVYIDTKKAQLQQHYEPPEVEITRDRGGLVIDNPPAQWDIDNRAFFDSMGLKSISALADDLIERGKKAALQSEADACREADILAEPHNENALNEIAIQRSQKTIETMLAFIPSCPPEINWYGGGVKIDYTPDRLNFAWQTGGVQGTYIPYRVDYNVVK
ncbi:MAG: DUF6470 family protein [Clostridia bacterium]|nr:DUF6470 family protein [Clostridia bacterium]